MIIFLYGEDTFRSFKKLKELEEKFVREVDASKMNLRRLDERASPEALRQAIFSPPFLARKRFVSVPDLGTLNSEAREELLNCLEKAVSEEMILVVRYPAALGGTANLKTLLEKLKKIQYAEEFLLLRGKFLEKAVGQMAAEAGASLSAGALKVLLALTAGDLWQTQNELVKLAAFAQGRTIEEKDVLALVKGSFDENIFALTDALANRKSAEAAWQMESQVRAGLAPFLLLSRLVGCLRLLLAVKLLLKQGMLMPQISRELSLHPYVSEKISRQVKLWDEAKLKKAYQELLILETKAKTGQGDIKTLLTVFLAGFC